MQLNFMIELRHFSLAAAVLSHEQFKFIENEWSVVTRDDLDDVDAAEMDMEEVRAGVERFRANDELQAWLTKVWGMQRELQWVHGRRRSLAEDALEVLRAYQAGSLAVPPGCGRYIERWARSAAPPRISSPARCGSRWACCSS